MVAHTWRRTGAAAAPSQPIRPTVTKDTRPGFRPYLVEVREVIDLAPHMRRVIFAGPELRWFGTDGYDQRIKVMLPLPDDGSGRGPWGDPQLFDPDSIARGGWWDQWRQLPVERRNPFRTYTVRGVDVEAGELTIDFARHGELGPAGTFVEHAAIGDRLVVIGPDSRSLDSALGIDFHCGVARHVLLAGDETAVPAIGAIIDTLARERRFGEGPGCLDVVQAIVELPQEADFAALPAPAGMVDGVRLGDFVRICHVSRGGRPHGEALVEAVQAWADGHMGADAHRQRSAADGASDRSEVFTEVNVDDELLWEVSDGPTQVDGYAWVAGEAAMVRDIRRILMRDYGMDRSAVAFMGYWRQGKSEN